MHDGRPESCIPMKRYAITGFVIWAAATIAIRLAGQYLFRFPLLLLIVSIPAMIFVAIAVVGQAQDRARAAIALDVTGDAEPEDAEVVLTTV